MERQENKKRDVKCKRRVTTLKIALTKMLIVFATLSTIVKSSETKFSARSQDFFSKLDSLKWICYAPSHPWQPGHAANPDSLRADLQVLRDWNFEGILTYGSSDQLDSIPRIAESLGFEGMIMGVWIGLDTLQNNNEIQNAIAESNYVDAYCVGNEVLLRGDQDTNYLWEAMLTVQNSTGKPVTTADGVGLYLGEYGLAIQKWLFTHGDWIFPITNPTNHDVKKPDSGFIWVKEKFDTLSLLRDTLAAGKTLILKECGWPTNSNNSSDTTWANEENQKQYFNLLDVSYLDFFYFEAYDQFWKTYASPEPYWGLFDLHRIPKQYIIYSIEEQPIRVPLRFDLLESFPNPFTSSTVISYQLSTKNKVSLNIYDSVGRLVKTFNCSPDQQFNQVIWDSRDNNRCYVSKGVYFVQLETHNKSVIKKIIKLE